VSVSSGPLLLEVVSSAVVEELDVEAIVVGDVIAPVEVESVSAPESDPPPSSPHAGESRIAELNMAR
jgi:hypothetical protein